VNTLKTLGTCLFCLIRSLKFYGFEVAVCRGVPKPVGHFRARFEHLTTLLMEIEVLCDNNVMFNGLLFGMPS